MNLLRPKATYAKFGCGKTKFDEDYRFHSVDNPNVPGTDIPRLKPIPLGERNIGYLEHEADALIDALAQLRDAPEAGTRTTHVFLTDAMPPKLELRRELLERRNRLRAQAIADADPELRTQLEGVDRALRALEQTRSADTS